jgi:hypothetical protein
MPTAPPFINPSDVGMDHVTGGNSTDILHGVLEFWRGIGVEGHWFMTTMVFGFIPIILGVMVYMRYQKMVPALMSSLFGMMFIMGIELFYYARIGVLVHYVVSVGFSLVAIVAIGSALSSTGGEEY